MHWLYKLERKFGKFCIPNLMLYIVLTMLAVYVLAFVGIDIGSLLSLTRDGVLRGQIWRLVTFVFLPPGGSVIFVLIGLYFYYFIGSSLENAWGAFQFNVYYIVGVLGAIIAGLISGYGSNVYLNMSLFLAFAQLFPEERVLLFYIIPIKVKYLAYIDWALFAVNFVFGNWSIRMSILASLINFFIFFGPDVIKRFRSNRQYSATRRNWQREMHRNNNNNHYAERGRT